MKFNLKNRPKKWTQWTGVNRDISNEVSLPQNIEDWFSGFEAELGEMYEKHQFKKNRIRACFCELIEVILGE